jgi:hypothetical protein
MRREQRYSYINDKSTTSQGQESGTKHMGTLAGLEDIVGNLSPVAEYGHHKFPITEAHP